MFRTALVLSASARAAPGIHVIKAGGWYAQISAKVVVPGEIRATVRGVLVTEATTAYVSVKADANSPELRVWFRATDDQWNSLRTTLKELNGKIGLSAKVGDSALYFLDLPDIKEVAKK